MSSRKVAKDIVQSSLVDIKPITDNQKIRRNLEVAQIVDGIATQIE